MRDLVAMRLGFAENCRREAAFAEKRRGEDGLAENCRSEEGIAEKRRSEARRVSLQQKPARICWKRAQ